jgi:hypothetical protein
LFLPTGEGAPRRFGGLGGLNIGVWGGAPQRVWAAPKVFPCGSMSATAEEPRRAHTLRRKV